MAKRVLGMRSKTVSLKKNFIYNVVLQLASLIVPFITTPYVSRVLGADNIGDYSYATAMVNYFVLIAALGTNLYGQRKIAFYREDKIAKSRVFWNVFLFRLIMSCIAIIMYVTYIRFFESFTSITLLVGLNIVNVIVDISWYFQGTEDFKSVSTRNLLFKILSFIAILIWVKTVDDTWIYVLILMLSYVLGSISMWIFIPSEIVFVEGINPFEGTKEILLIFLPNIAIQVYTILDKTMIRWITKSSYENGCYEMAERIARIVLTVITSIGAVLLPRIANMYSNNNEGEIKQYIYKSFRLVFMLACPMMFGLMAISSFFVPLFLGDGYDEAIGLLMILSCFVLVIGEAYVIGISYLVSTEQQNVYTKAVTVAAILNLIMNLILIPKIGAYGAAIASVVAETTVLMIELAYCINKKGFSASNFIKDSFRYFLVGLIMFIIVVFTKQMLTCKVSSICILIVEGIMIYSIPLLLMKDDMLLYVIKRNNK